MPNVTLEELFLTSLAAIKVTASPTVYSTTDFRLKKKLLYRPGELQAPVHLNVELNAEELMDAGAMGTSAKAELLGKLFGQIVMAIYDLENPDR